MQEAIKTNLERGFSFLFLRCGSNFQALTFPPTFKKVEDGKSRSSININVIMLDSISRPHFYRTLPRVIGALRKITEDPNIKASALDFELDQSIGQQTFENLRPFFSGVLKGGFSVLCSLYFLSLSSPFPGIMLCNSVLEIIFMMQRLLNLCFRQT